MHSYAHPDNYEPATILAFILANGKGWRFHGNGFMQVDLPDPSQRVHVWGHPAIPRQVRASQIHDHRFGFVSRIISGSIVNQRWYDKRPHRDTDFILCDMHTPVTWGNGEDTKLELHERGVKLYPGSTILNLPGQTYGMKPRQLHSTYSNEPTVTFMEKTEIDDSYVPMVATLTGVEPDNSFNRYDYTSIDPRPILQQSLGL